MSVSQSTITPRQPATIQIRRKLLAVAITQAVLCAASPVNGATITVDDAGDVSAAGNCTLRDAIFGANSDSSVAGCAAGAGADTITFDPSIVPGTITLLSGELLISSAMSIQGPGSDELTVSGNDTSRIFRIDDGTTESVLVTLDGLTLAGGSADFGGAIYNRETLIINACVVSNSNADRSGGGISNFTGTITLTNTSLFGNAAVYHGGGINNDQGIVHLTDSTLSNNTSVLNAGGIRSSSSLSTSSTLTLARSTLTGNSAGWAGGGIHNSGELTLTNSILSGNTSDSEGGGIVNSGAATVTYSTLSSNSGRFGGGIFSTGTTLTLTNTTLSGNTALYGGGGIANHSPLTLNNSTLSGNISLNDFASGLDNLGIAMLTNSIIASSAGGSDCDTDFGTVASNLNNLIEDGSCPDGAINMLTGDPQLGPLQDNGGTTFTHSLLPGSRAIDMGDSVECPISDQRGVARNDGACDIGAFEVDKGVVFADGFE